MRMPDTVDILKPQQVKDSKGIIITQYIKDRTILCDFQPMRYNVQYKPYGITDKTSNVAYCKDFNITADMRIGHDGKQYIIDSILTYRKHVEIYLEKVI